MCMSCFAMALRTNVLEHLERKSSDFLILVRDLDADMNRLANELIKLLKAGYVTKTNGLFCITDRGREYLKVEKSET